MKEKRKKRQVRTIRKEGCRRRRKTKKKRGGGIRIEVSGTKRRDGRPSGASGSEGEK